MRKPLLLAIFALLTGCATQLYWPQKTGSNVGPLSLAKPEEWELIRQRMSVATRENLGTLEDVETIEDEVKSHLKDHIESTWARNSQLSMRHDIRWLSPNCAFVWSIGTAEIGYRALWAGFFHIYEKQRGDWKLVIFYTEHWVERVI